MRFSGLLLLTLIGWAAGCAESRPAPSADQGGQDGAVADASRRDLSAPRPDAGCGCDDGVACTIDVCMPGGGCEHELDQSRCAQDELCTASGCVRAAQTSICRGCTKDGDCDPDQVCALVANDGGAGRFCLARCRAGSSCQKGFSCDDTGTPPRCVPAGGTCCFDSDGDRRGQGAGCAGSDCDDHDPAVHVGHAEVCDGKDNDCDGKVDDTDEGPLCGVGTCDPVPGSTAFVGRAAGACTQGACTQPPTASCGLYTCAAAPVPGASMACRAACGGQDDAACIAGAFCDGAACQARLTDGAICTRDRMCASGHCQNGHCCGAGDCCATAADCPASYAFAPVCDAPETACQGHRVDKICVASTCGSQAVPDDRACSSSTTIDCGAYPAQACTGAADQAPLACPTSCTDDSACGAAAYCAGGKCVARQADGGSCTSPSQCLGGRSCLNGHCCVAGSGACCATASDCPDSYAAPAACDAPLTSCQGHRLDKTCTAFVCGSSSVDDDRACGTAVSQGCGAYQAVACSGAASQAPLTCPTTCATDDQCVAPANHCLAGQCVPWRENGTACTVSGQCRSGFCVSGICCNTACSATACDACGSGTCSAFFDPYEAGDRCLSALPDLGGGSFVSTVSAYIESTSDGEDWYQFYAFDDDAAPCSGAITVTLDGPPSTDYDVYVYDAGPGGACTGDLAGLSLKTSYPETITFEDPSCGDDSGWFFVRVVRYAGLTGNASCTQPYTLRVDAHL